MKSEDKQNDRDLLENASSEEQRQFFNLEESQGVDLLSLHDLEGVKKGDQEQSPPFSLILFFFFVTFIASGYLFYFSGNFSADIYDDIEVMPMGASLVGDQKIDPVAMGGKLYAMNCASCHQVNGEGVVGQYPPLAGSEIVIGEEGYGVPHLARIVFNGLSGPVTVRGTLFNGSMPSQKAVLKPNQVAYILSYIRQAWGNKASMVEVDEVESIYEKVKNISETWTIPRLKKIPVASPSP